MPQLWVSLMREYIWTTTGARGEETLKPRGPVMTENKLLIIVTLIVCAFFLKVWKDLIRQIAEIIGLILSNRLYLLKYCTYLQCWGTLTLNPFQKACILCYFILIPAPFRGTYWAFYCICLTAVANLLKWRFHIQHILTNYNNIKLLPY